MDKDERLVWVDIETTGLDETTDAILEVGMVVTTPDLLVEDAGSWVLYDPQIAARLATLARTNPEVYQMHSKSGLLTDVSRWGMLPDNARLSIERWWSRCCVRKPLMCGNSVHFDRRFLRAHLPSIEGLFHYRNLDVSSLYAAMSLWSKSKNLPVKNPTPLHRAIPDLMDSLMLARQIQKHLGAL